MEAKIAYDKSDLRKITRAFKAMDDEATAQAKKQSNALAQFAADKIKVAAGTRIINASAARRIADGVRVSKTSRIGELSYGFASQKFSGGGTTQFNPPRQGGNGLLAGMEFGSNRYKQFPKYSGRYGRGSKGYFIYPTLRQIQPEIVAKWESAFDQILKEWG